MKDTPLLMCGEMVRATLEGRKLQTRRVMKPQPQGPLRNHGAPILAPDFWIWEGHHTNWDAMEKLMLAECPYGVPGDRLWVRETFLYRARKSAVIYRANLEKTDPCECAGVGAMYGGWKPSIHMPRWASRLSLEVVSVRVQRVQDISEEDAWLEGVAPRLQTTTPPIGYGRERFQSLWDSINAKRAEGIYAWSANPWLWAIEFKRI